jgi:hypothetical protein
MDRQRRAQRNSRRARTARLRPLRAHQLCRTRRGGSRGMLFGECLWHLVDDRSRSDERVDERAAVRAAAFRASGTDSRLTSRNAPDQNDGHRQRKVDFIGGLLQDGDAGEFPRAECGIFSMAHAYPAPMPAFPRRRPRRGARCTRSVAVSTSRCGRSAALEHVGLGWIRWVHPTLVFIR